MHRKLIIIFIGLALFNSCQRCVDKNLCNDNSYYTVGLNPFRNFVGLLPIYQNWIYSGESLSNGLSMKVWLNPLLHTKYFTGVVKIVKPCYGIKYLWFDMDILICEADVYISSETYKATVYSKVGRRNAVLNKQLWKTYYYYQRNGYELHKKWDYIYHTSENEGVHGIITKTQADSISYSWGLQ